MSGRSRPAARRATIKPADRVAIDGRLAAVPVQQRGGPERRRASRGRPARVTGASRIATSSSTSARTPPRPTSTAGPNCWSRSRPTMSCTPSGIIGATRRPVRVAAAGSGSSRSSPGGRVRPRSASARPEPNPADLRLVGEPGRVELQHDRDSRGVGRGDGRVRGHGADRVARSAGPLRPSSVEAVDLGQDAPLDRAGRRRLRRQHRGRGRRCVRSAARAGQRRPPRTGVAAAPHVGAPSGPATRSP